MSNVCRSVYVEITSVRSNQYLTVETTQTLVCVFVLCKLNYCNSLLSGCPLYPLSWLQKVQNSAAKLVFKARKCDHVRAASLSSFSFVTDPSQNILQTVSYLSQCILWLISCPSLWTLQCVQRFPTASVFCRHMDISHTTCYGYNLWPALFSFFLCSSPKQCNSLPSNVHMPLKLNKTTTNKQTSKTKNSPLQTIPQ